MSKVVVKYAGYFGKYPGYRDFVQSGLSGSRVQWFREWIGAVMDEGARSFEDDWMDIYLHSPVWCYLCPDDQSSHSVMGAIMSSLDARGRYFPLVVEWGLAQHVSTSFFKQHQPRYDALVDAMIATLSEPYANIDDVHHHFDDFFDNHVFEESKPSTRPQSPSDSWVNNLLSAIELSLASPKNRMSLWQASLRDDQSPMFRFMQGWPSSVEFVAMQHEAVKKLAIQDSGQQEKTLEDSC